MTYVSLKEKTGKNEHKRVLRQTKELVQVIQGA